MCLQLDLHYPCPFSNSCRPWQRFEWEIDDGDAVHPAFIK